MKPWLLSIPTIAACIWFAPAAHAVLKTGDPAPKIQVSAWAQGDEVKDLEGDKVYIVEFWATWCGPCVASIPHINEIQKKYKDKGLVVIGQNLGEDKKTVTDFIKQMGGKMGYRVTVDDKTDGGWMGKHWLTAAGQNGIPCAFVVNKKGNIAYIGHPMSLKEEVLEKLLAEPSTKASAEPAAPAEDAAPSAKATELATRAKTEIAAGKLAEAEATIAQLQEALPAKLGYIGGLAQLDLLIAQKQPGDAVELSKLLCEDYAAQPAVVAEVAAHLVAQDAPAASLKSAAEKIATPLAETEGFNQSAALLILSRIASLNGDNARAEELKVRATVQKSMEAQRQRRLIAE